MRIRFGVILVGLWGAVGTPTARAADPPLADYFRAEVARIEAKPLAGMKSAEAWKAERPELQRKLHRMLGLDPMPERTPLKPLVTGTVDRPDFTVELILFQSSPGLYVTANLYRPKTVAAPLPAILYLCGHGQVEKDGVIFGNKAHYQHHAAWYASNGYICLVLDTLQLGELPGLHHGTSRFGLWWWPARGYTPAGVEAWNAVRALDYLETRREVDPKKIGVTGRSGGGATTWWVAAIDDRVAAAVPVAGITDLRNHVVDGVVEGHCDCMYHVNMYRWDFDTVAALVAPRPMLVENTDKDGIFPEDGVRRIYKKLETVYGWYAASDRLGLVIGKGGHADTVELRHPSFAFMDKWLKAVDRPIVEPDRHIPDELLQVMANNPPPPDNRNPTIHENFSFPRIEPEPTAPEGHPFPPRPETKAEEIARVQLASIKRLASEVFAGWPTSEEAGPVDRSPGTERVRNNLRFVMHEYTSQPGVRLRSWTIELAPGLPKGVAHRLVVIDEESWRGTWSAILESTNTPRSMDAGNGTPDWMDVRNRVLSGQRVVLIAPRGIGPTAWPPEKDRQIRRRFMLLGQTLDGMRAWDVARGIEAWRSANRDVGVGVTFAAKGDAATWLLWGLAMRPDLKGDVDLARLVTSVHEGPAYLNLETTTMSMPDGVELLWPRKVRLRGASKGDWIGPRVYARFATGDDSLEWPMIDE